jgi:oligopeptide/dipeptide ABC transporter ATP-binding protein
MGEDMTGELLRVEALRLRFPARRRAGFGFSNNAGIQAVDDVSFVLGAGKTLGLVGESGCGKSSAARAILRLEDNVEGQVFFRGVDIMTLSMGTMRRTRRDIQMVFQDPFSSLDPRMRVGDIVAEPLDIHGLATGRLRAERVMDLLNTVGLDRACVERFPHEFSGGQRQRIGIARALAAEPSLIICDEPVSALDVSIQAQIVNLLKDLQVQLGLTYLFISHDLSVVRHISDRIAVMYLGRIVELAPRDALFDSPMHPYTQMLLEAVLIPDPRKARSKRRSGVLGELPCPTDTNSGCTFRTRCRFERPICAVERPAFDEVTPGRFVACHFWRETQHETPAVTAMQ